MILISPTISVLEPTDSLDCLSGAAQARELFLDFETSAWRRVTSGQVERVFDEYGNAPYKLDRICGAAVTWDDNPMSYYVPMRHLNRNVPLESAQRWLRDALRGAKDWVNHNVKFDAHFAAQESPCDGLGKTEFGGRLIDTLTRAKLIDSDRIYRGGYGLDILARDWLDMIIKPKEDAITQYLENFKRGNKKCKDYSVVPVDIMGEYACTDVLTNRRLHHTMLRMKDPSGDKVWDLETLLTPVLYDIEKKGMRVDVAELEELHLQLSYELQILQEQIHTLAGRCFDPGSNPDCYALLCGQFGLPVLVFTNQDDPGAQHNPSFTADALVEYLQHPVVHGSPKLTTIIQVMRTYRERAVLRNTFVRPYLELCARQPDGSGILHPSYNQCVNTGRMGCKTPNSQQLSPEAKELIHPDPGCSFLSMDESQVEFRIIVHYIKNKAAIDSYAENPDTDFHAWVAKMCDIHRKPAKNVNFCMGYSGGKGKVVKMLSANIELVGSLAPIATLASETGELPEGLKAFAEKLCLPEDKEYSNKHVPQDVKDCAKSILWQSKGKRSAIFKLLCNKRGVDVYEQYHRTLPELKNESRMAMKTCESRGHVKTLMGRKRNLPERFAWRAFNTVTQGSAADMIKETAVRAAPRYNAAVREASIDIIAQVHDENLFHGPSETMRDPKIIKMLADIMEHPSIELRVPLRTSASISNKNWYAVEPIPIPR